MSLIDILAASASLLSTLLGSKNICSFQTIWVNPPILSFEDEYFFYLKLSITNTGFTVDWLSGTYISFVFYI